MSVITPNRACWRGVERVGELQASWHDATPKRSQHPGDDSRPGVHSVVLGRVLPKTRLINDCSGGKVKAVDPISAIYTKDEAEAESAYHIAVADAQSRRVDKARHEA